MRLLGNSIYYQDIIGALKATDGRIVRICDTVDKKTIRPRDIMIRHDIDDNLDAAVRMAEREAQMGVVSTYYMLDTASYFYKPESIQKYQYIQSLGHEIGWHNNALAVY